MQVEGDDAAAIILGQLDPSGDGTISFDEFVLDVLGLTPGGKLGDHSVEGGPFKHVRSGSLSD